MQSTNSGFTLIEVLFSIAIFAIFMSIGLVTFVKNVQANGRNTDRVNSNITTQQLVESIKSKWSNPSDYNRNCITDLTLPADSTLKSQPMQAMIGSAGVAPVQGSVQVPVPACSKTMIADTTIPIMRRVNLTVSTGGQKSNIIFDVLNPGVK